MDDVRGLLEFRCVLEHQTDVIVGIEEPFEIFGRRARIDQLLPWIALAFELVTDLDHLGGDDAEAHLEFLLTRVSRLTDERRERESIVAQ